MTTVGATPATGGLGPQTRAIARVLVVVPPLVNIDGDTSPDRPEFEAYRLVSPVEPATVAADLLQRGFTVKVFDLGAYTRGRLERLGRQLSSFRPDAVVLVQSILTFATAQDWDGRPAFDLARSLRPGMVTVLTGTHATNYPGRAVADGVCEYSIKGEVDFAVGELLAVLNSDGDPAVVQGVSFRAGSGEVWTASSHPSVDVSKLLVPAYSAIDAEQQVQYTRTLERAKIRFPEKSCRYRDIMTSRGCLLRCSFCSVAYLRGERQAYRRKPIDLVMAEIESALADGVEEVHFFDDLFGNTETELVAFANELVRRNLRFPWFVAQGMPLWPLTRDALAALVATGMYRLICPFESGSNRVLRRVIGKIRSTVDHHHDVIVWARQLGLEIVGMFVVGMPGEKRHEILETVRFAEAHPEIDYSVFSIATPMVGTRLMKQVTREGRLGDPDAINRIIKRTVALYQTDEFSAYEMGVIRTFDWDRINFASEGRCATYAQMVGISTEELGILRDHSKQTFYRFFPDYDGPLSFHDLYTQPGLFRSEPLLPATPY